ncbi:UDP-N-acetylmuramate dehydrogenase [Candidatus Roizmanbacteria bacterium]|nr:UDP-N-acetylmuramate dehydrogenase [Candidatus Roizmanbacteria bacterium]
MNRKTSENALQNALGARLKQNVDLAPYLTLKTRTTAAYYFEAKSRADLLIAASASRQAGLPLVILGGGSNLAIATDRLEKLIVKNFYQQKKIDEETSDYVILGVSSGYPVGRLVKETTGAGWAGFEYHLGLPGTVGGAIYMNSKWTRPESYFGGTLVAANIIDKTGRVKKVNRDYFRFAYDYSILQQTHEVVLEAVFKLAKAEAADLQRKAQEALEYRKQTQPFGVFSSGCFFRNVSQADQVRLRLPTASAGYLIDKAGLKGLAIGNFYVSEKHANFILNRGAGSPDDLKRIIGTIKSKVKDAFGLELNEEVIVM